MIKGVIIVNNLGVVRLAKFYEQVHVTGESAEQAQGPRHRRDACSMAWRCRFLAARPSQDGRVITEK